MSKIFFIIGMVCSLTVFGQDWKDYPVPANAGTNMVWKLVEDVSDDFNYEFTATSSAATINGKWTNFYHNGWTGPKPTVWKRDHVSVSDGKFQIKASRKEGENVTFSYGGKSYTLPATYLGCATSVKQVQYPVYVETYVKIMKSTLASDVWMLSSDDTQEIDICEAYGADRYTNEWFSNKRLHLSHHVFIRSPFQDWQPNDEGSFYTDGSTIWSDGYHRIGVYWKDPWNLEYYVDGKLVRTRSGKDQIDPKGFTNGKGLHKAMDIIINTEDQTWRAIQGLTPTDREMSQTDNNTFNVDWVRVYKPEPVNGSSSFEKSKIKIFPNPFENTVLIDSGSQEMKQLAIYDVEGKLSIKKGLQHRVESINTQNLTPGMYILKIQTENGIWSSHKIVKL